MIRQPKTGMLVEANYADKSMRLQGLIGTIGDVSKGPGPRNVSVCFIQPDYVDIGRKWYEIIPHGNLIERKELA